MKAQLGLFLIRAVPAAFMLFSHGWGKLQGFASMKDSFPDPIGVGPEISLALTVMAEVGCAALVAVGLFTRWAAAPLAFTMFVAAFVIHAADPFAKKEFALLYAVIFLANILLGPGKWSLDYFVRKRL